MAGEIRGTIARLALTGENGTQAAVVAPLAGQSGDLRGAVFMDGASPVYNLVGGSGIDGSGTPVVIEAGPTGETWYDVELRILIEGGSSFGASKFGAATGLSPGLTVETKGTALAVPLMSNGVAELFGSVVKGSDYVVWCVPLCAVLGDGDLIEMTVAENLTAVATVTNAQPVIVYRVHP